MPRYMRREDLPERYLCRTCETEKAIAEMITFKVRRTGQIGVRSRCKECHNKMERGHRREWKRKYLRIWRKRNKELNDSYWRARQAENREDLNLRANFRFYANHDALLVQGRLRRRLGLKVSIAEARELVRKFGRCYPTRFGLTAAGLRECERIRSRMRVSGGRVKPIEIRMMVYEDSIDKYPGYKPTKGGQFVISPSKQRQPYEKASQRLKAWRASNPRVGDALRKVA